MSTSVYYAEETYQQNGNTVDDVNQFLLSPTSADQYFTVVDNALHEFDDVGNSITFIAAPALRSPQATTQPGVSIFRYNGDRKYAESQYRCGVLFDYVTTKDDYLDIVLDKSHPTQSICLMDGAAGILPLYDHNGVAVPANRFILNETTFRVYWDGVPDNDETSYYTTAQHVHGLIVLPLFPNIQDVSNVEVDLSLGTHSGHNPPPLKYLGQLYGNTIWTGHRFTLAIDTQNLASIKRRVDGANAYATFTGGALDNGWISGCPFRESAMIPLTYSNSLDQVSEYISSMKGARSKAMMSGGETNGEYGYFIPSLVPDWEEMVNNIRNNPFTGTCDAKKYYQWAIRYIVKPNDPTKRIVTFKGCYVFEGSSDSKLFDPTVAPTDPMWPQYHHVLVRDYMIMTNEGHISASIAKFKECVNSVLNYGKSLITVDNVEKVLSKGAEITIPLLASALALV